MVSRLARVFRLTAYFTFLPPLRDVRRACAISRRLWELRKSGIGIIIEEVGAAEPLVKRVLPDFAIPVPMWLVSHREVHTSRRVRMVFDLLVDELGTSRRAGSSAKPPRRAKANAKRKGKKT